MVTQAYHSRFSSESYQGRPKLLETFKPSYAFKQGEKQKRRYPKSDYRILTSDAINKPAMNNRRLLIEAVFHFVHPVEKGS